MIRIVIENILLLLLPTLIYFGYIFLTRSTQGARKQAIDDAPLLWLFAAGVMMVVAVLVVFGSTTGGKPGETYRPPSFEGGKIVPGKLQREGDGDGNGGGEAGRETERPPATPDRG